MARTKRVGPYRRKDGTMVHGYTRKVTRARSSIDYSELDWKMDKYMPDDDELMNEYFELLAAKDADALVSFFYENAYDNMDDYMPKGGSVEGFVRYLLRS